MTKQYNVKYEVGQDVYVLRDKKISKNRIYKIRVTEQQPYTKSNPDGTYTEMDGIEIDYLIETERDFIFIHPHTQSTQSSYDWYNEEDVFTNKDELIAQIV
tara:strand:- start:156 stop:458 length:303 start_codon:yes stop_codon:yes gene_type:complete